MSFEAWFLFLITVSIVVCMPGPSTLNQVRVGLSTDSKHCVMSAIGGSSVANLYLIISFWFIHLISDIDILINSLQLFGCVYLLYIGFITFNSNGNEHINPIKNGTYWYMYKLGAFVELSNPKSILFFSALMPQFITSTTLNDYFIVASTWTVIDLTVMIGYAILAMKLSEKIKTLKSYMNVVVGSFLMLVASIGFVNALSTIW